LEYQLSFENKTTNKLLFKKLKHILNCDYQENLNTFLSTHKNNSSKTNCHSSDICLSSNVPDEGYSSNVSDEGYSRNVPDEGYSSNVPDDGYSRNALCTLNLIFMFL
jgi:hypothetical protein